MVYANASFCIRKWEHKSAIIYCYYCCHNLFLLLLLLFYYLLLWNNYSNITVILLRCLLLLCCLLSSFLFRIILWLVIIISLPSSWSKTHHYSPAYQLWYNVHCKNYCVCVLIFLLLRNGDHHLLLKRTTEMEAIAMISSTAVKTTKFIDTMTKEATTQPEKQLKLCSRTRFCSSALSFASWYQVTQKHTVRHPCPCLCWICILSIRVFANSTAQDIRKRTLLLEQYWGPTAWR